jgi:hypothetical protein
MKNAPVAKQENALSTDLAQWDSDIYVGGKDVMLAKILPMQGMSVLVTDGKAVMGEFRDSLSGEKLGSIVDPVEILPFHVEKQWDILHQNDEGKFKWNRSIPRIDNPAQEGYNDNLAWQDKENDKNGKLVDIKRVQRFNFYVLLPSQMKSGEVLPYVLSFKSTSFREGKKMFTQMYLRNKVARLPPPGFTFKLAGLKTKNDQGTFIVPTVELGRKTTPEEINKCLDWYKLIMKGGVKVDDSDDTAVDVDSTPLADTGEF